MNRDRCVPGLLLAFALAPQTASAGIIDESEIGLTAFTSFDTQACRR